MPFKKNNNNNAVRFCSLFAGHSLKCYTCASIKSWDDCAANKKETTCVSGQDRCGKMYVDGKIGDVGYEGFSKGCAANAACNKDACKNINPSLSVSKCDINCCEGDLCNGAKVPVVSAIVLLACALVAFFR